MKHNLLLEYRDDLILIAWARETPLGVYMGVRFSPGVENASYFRDGRRQLLRFPLTANGKRKREEVPLADQTPITSIESSELILERTVELCGDTSSNSPAPKPAPGTMETIIPEVYLGDSKRLYYDAHLVRTASMRNLTGAKDSDPKMASRGRNPLHWVLALDCFPEHSLVLNVSHGDQPAETPP